MEKSIVLENVLNGYFLTPSKFQKYHDPATNIPVTGEREQMILSEFKDAIFVAPNDHVSKAETDNFNFYRYEEEQEDKITWVEIKGATITAE